MLQNTVRRNYSKGVIGLLATWKARIATSTPPNTDSYTVWVYPLEDILDAPLAGILSIDTEGMDTKILKAFLESEHAIPWPQFLMIEGNTPDEQVAQRLLAMTHGYAPIAVIPPNQMFVYRGNDR